MTPTSSEIEMLHPVQGSRKRSGSISSKVSLRAYEVYVALYGQQEQMITGHCRGGFSVGELIAFLYARSFPQDQWRERFDEALKGMDL